MNKIKVKIHCRDVDVNHATIRGSRLSSGFDIRANLLDRDFTVDLNKKLGLHKMYRITSNGVIILEPNSRVLIPSGLRFNIPPGYELQIRPRSGLAIKNGITVLNTPGTIDADFRGEVCIILYNSSTLPFSINHGDRIAQGVFSKVLLPDFEEVFNIKDLDETERGEGGFGSTGV
jgi:dUTP pyrophosphatase